MLTSGALFAAAWSAALAWLATSDADRVVTLGVAVIGAVASLGTAWIATRARQEARGQRVVVTKHDDGSVTVSNEDREPLMAPEELGD